MGANARLLRRPRALCFVAAVVLASQFVPVASQAGASGSIAGSVEDVGGSAIQGICVDVVDVATGIRTQQTVTDANGMYTAADLAPGSYKVRFSDCVAPNDFATEWNGGVREKHLASPVTVSVGGVVEVDASMDPWGAVTGSVEDVGGSAIRDICVRAFDQVGRGVGWSRTDANGMYTLKIRSLLGTGSYMVRFKDCIAPNEYVPEWNGDRRLMRHVRVVTVTVGQDTQVDAALERWGAISGTVTDEATSMPLPDICVRVFRRILRHHVPKGVAWARTDADGTYTVIIRKTWIGFYKVRFSDCIHPRGYVTEFYDNSFNRWRPTFVTVNRGKITSGIDAALSGGADLSLTKNDSNDPVRRRRRISYSIRVRNHGPDPATGVTVIDELPAGVRFVSASSAGGSCSESAGIVTCTYASPLTTRGGTLTVKIVVVAPPTPGTISNTARVSANGGDPVLGNNQDTETTQVI
jgi:uncharacterized repeat protein (TIGR01451 family)